MLKTDHYVVGIAHDDHVARGLALSPAFSPEIVAVVQIGVSQERDITDPCPVPFSLTVTTPSSSMPALSHFWIKWRMRGSAIRCSKNFINQGWLTSSKDYSTDYPPPRSSSRRLSRSGNHRSVAPSL